MSTRAARYAHLLVAIAGGLVGSAAPATAESESPPVREKRTSPAETAKDLKEANDLAKTGKCAEALVRFHDVYVRAPSVAALLGVARCQRTLGRPLEALATYEKVRELPALSPSQAADVSARTAEIMGSIATVSIRVSSAGAIVELDGKNAGVTPLPQPIRVVPGTHSLRVSSATDVPYERSFDAAVGQKVTLDVQLDPQTRTGHVVVRERRSANVRVIVDQRPVGQTPWEGDMPAGTHTLELRGDQSGTPTQSFDVHAKTRHDFVLEASPLKSHFSVSTMPGDASLTLDGQLTPIPFEGEVEVGTHSLEVFAVDHDPVHRMVLLMPGEPIDERIVLQPEHAAPRSPEKSTPVELTPYRGVYADVSLFGGLPVHRRPSYCTEGASCTGFATRSGFLTRIGYGFDVIGLELLLAPLGEVAVERASYSNDGTLPHVTSSAIDASFAREEAFLVGGYGVLLGVGARASTMTSGLRLTAGAAFGGLYQKLFLRRQETVTISETYIQSASNVAPALAFDVGVLLGGTPGSKFKLGVTLMVDFPGVVSTSEVAPSAAAYPGIVGNRNLNHPAYALTSATEVVIAPSLGIQFGR